MVLGIVEVQRNEVRSPFFKTGDMIESSRFGCDDCFILFDSEFFGMVSIGTDCNIFSPVFFEHLDDFNIWKNITDSVLETGSV